MFSKSTSKNRKITITRNFDATPEQVWRAWTESELLDQWWAPKPWKANTKLMEFTEGGMWLYCMAGPNGEKHYSLVSYKTIDPEKAFTAKDNFCNEDGVMARICF